MEDFSHERTLGFKHHMTYPFRMNIKFFIFRYKKIIFPATSVILCLCFFLVGSEITIRKLEKHFLSTALDYGDVIGGGLKGGGLQKANLDVHVIDALGNQVKWETNSVCFRNDQEFSPKPAQNTLRILAMGDSFMAGYRVGQESTLPFLLEKGLKSQEKIEVLNSMIESPSTGLVYLEKFGHSYHPHATILGITLGNDIQQSFSVTSNPKIPE